MNNSNSFVDDYAATPPYHVVKLLILEKRNNLIEAFEDYYKNLLRGFRPGVSVVKARIKSLFLEVNNILSNRLSSEDYDELINNINSNDINELEKAFLVIDKVLYDIRLTKIDDKAVINKKVVENENKYYGL